MLRSEVSVLVVDDVNAMRAFVRDLLKDCGFSKIRLASSGQEAQAMLAAEPTHLVMADWQMQPMDGLELLKYVRAQESLKQIAFIMVTAENAKERVIEAIKSGLDSYIMKPLLKEQIETKVYEVLLKRGIIGT